MSDDQEPEVFMLPDHVADLANSITDRREAALAWLGSRSLSKDFLDQLVQEPSDWAFILKIAALAEALISDWLAHVLPGAPELAQSYRTKGIPLTSGNRTILVHADSTFGQKVSLCEALEIYEPHEIAWLRAINELRNTYAHKIEHVHHSIGDILQSLPTREALDIADALYNCMDSIEVRNESLSAQASGMNVATLAKRNKLSWRKRLPRLMDDFEFTTLDRMLKGNHDPLKTMDFLNRGLHFTWPLSFLISDLHESKKEINKG